MIPPNATYTNTTLTLDATNKGGQKSLFEAGCQSYELVDIWLLLVWNMKEDLRLLEPKIWNFR